jgi:hypothetical protein
MKEIVSYEGLASFDLGTRLRSDVFRERVLREWRTAQRAYLSGLSNASPEQVLESTVSEYVQLLREWADEIGTSIESSGWGPSSIRGAEALLTGETRVACPGCGSEHAQRLVFASRFASAPMAGLLCPECGDVGWSFGLSRLRIDAATNVRGTRGTQDEGFTVRISNEGPAPMLLSARFAFEERLQQGFPDRGPIFAATVPAGGSVGLRVPVGELNNSVKLDQHRGWFVLLGGGAIEYRSVWLNVRGASSSGGIPGVGKRRTC